MFKVYTYKKLLHLPGITELINIVSAYAQGLSYMSAPQQPQPDFHKEKVIIFFLIQMSVLFSIFNERQHAPYLVQSHQSLTHCGLVIS